MLTWLKKLFLEESHLVSNVEAKLFPVAKEANPMTPEVLKAFLDDLILFAEAKATNKLLVMGLQLLKWAVDNTQLLDLVSQYIKEKGLIKS
jgi:hypothetical protein